MDFLQGKRPIRQDSSDSAPQPASSPAHLEPGIENVPPLSSGSTGGLKPRDTMRTMTIAPLSEGPGSSGPIRDARKPVGAHTTEDVRRYYDEKTAAYVEGFGEVFQGSRPESTEHLLDYILDSADMYDGMRILDAGCGVCGPAIWFAEHRDVTIEALTISPVQVREAKTRVTAKGLADRITVREGDFHRLAELYPPDSFDRVLFLETICHASDYRRVLEQVRAVLKPGGYLYIKDFYCPDFRSMPDLIDTQRKDLEALNRVYQLVLPDLASTIDLISELGFSLKFLREPGYEAVFGPWIKFEQVAGVAWNPKLSYLDLIAGMELLCRKPLDRT